MSLMDNVIIKPIISEKSLKEAAIGRYTFLVEKDATKKDVKRSVEKSFNVNVKGIFTNNIKKSKIISTKFGRKKTEHAYKKARVTLGKDQKIELFDEVVKEK